MRLHAIPADGLGDASLHDLKAAETFEIGAVVLLDANEEIIEASADPTSILGFAAHAAAPAFESVPVIEANKCLVFKATEGQKFWIAGDNDPTADDLNQEYGMAVDSDGIWYLDGTETTTTSLYVHDIDTDRNLYKVSVTVAERQAV